MTSTNQNPETIFKSGTWQKAKHDAVRKGPLVIDLVLYEGDSSLAVAYKGQVQDGDLKSALVTQMGVGPKWVMMEIIADELADLKGRGFRRCEALNHTFRG